MIELINRANALGINVEVKNIKNDYLMLRTLNEEVKQYETSNIDNYQIKAIVDGKTIIINTEDISDIESIINVINKNKELLDNTDEDVLAKENIIDDNIDRTFIDLEEIRNDMLELYKYKEKNVSIVNIDSIFEKSEKITNIINSDGIELKQGTDFKYLYVSVSVKEDERTSESSDLYLFNEYNKKDFIELFEKVLSDATNRLNEVSIESKEYNVIIDNNSMYSILNSFKDMFLAKNINKGLSILSDKYNKQIFSNLIDIVEEPLNDNLRGTYKVLFDSEGSKCQNKVIIKNGLFVNKLYDNKESIKDGVSSTGNSDGVNNMYLVPGNLDFNELVNNLDNGIIITDLSGLHSGINTITGDLSLDAKGYLVENGEITKALNSILLSANIFEIFNNVLYIGNDLKFGSTHVGAPSILCENIMIVGEK